MDKIWTVGRKYLKLLDRALPSQFARVDNARMIHILRDRARTENETVQCKPTSPKASRVKRSNTN